MEVSETLKKAWTAVEDAGLPEKIQEVAFREAVRLLVPTQVVAAASPAAPRTSGQTEKSGATSGSTGSGVSGGGSNGDGAKIAEAEDTILDKVAQHTGVSREKLEELVHLDDGVLKVSIPGIKLGKSNADKTRAIAQIITIVRGFGLDEQETSVELVRAEAQRLRCYDQANFSSQIRALNGYLMTGSGANRRIRAKSGGITAFPAFVDSLLDES
ncbi:hypothetical protein DT076_05015 [Desertihabitans brevis]|uniref:Uncharacterized protein n=1 Tax=Desertihabitans brevis TaxID=2268447 RepID=A0A367Z0H5_9ACTN|nr:hypothetical protein [Desertihabitans brevis]RCK70762.1 hypothetical protein DT076_05015 [Desertihabitans brevis]